MGGAPIAFLWIRIGLGGAAGAPEQVDGPDVSSTLFRALLPVATRPLCFRWGCAAQICIGVVHAIISNRFSAAERLRGRFA